MTLRHFQIFAEVVHCGKMNLAAKRLFVAQPTVSQAIAEMEKYYGIRLFERYPQGLVITEEGNRLYQQAVPLLEAYAHLEDTMKAQNRTHTLRIGGTLTVGDSVLRPLLRLYLRDHSDVNIQVTIDNTKAMEELLLANQLDAAIVEGEIHHPYLKTTPTMPDYLVLVCSPEHPFAARRHIAPEELAGQPFLLREAGSGTRLLFEQFMQERLFELNARWVCSSPETIKHAVMDGFGLSVISIRLVEQEIRRGELCLVDVEGCRFERQFSLVCHKDKFRTPQLEDFLCAVRNYEDNEILNLLPENN
ncbi:MAG: LysR family transcriptional regulator [Lachnospiraceae bacterium]|nr:LysR family transcriptional regulator [Lachnospiraceae bacterium]